VDVKYGFNSNLLLNLTETRFFSTDVDQEQFNLTPFPIFIPEKRQFFLENAGIFMTSHGAHDQLFLQPAVGNRFGKGNQVLSWRSEAAGTLGRLQFGVMDVDNAVEWPESYANYSIVRLKQSLWVDRTSAVMG